jgi:hypothetical protein
MAARKKTEKIALKKATPARKVPGGKLPRSGFLHVYNIFNFSKLHFCHTRWTYIRL